MKYYASKTTSYVKNFLSGQSQAVVHSVYRNTINVVTGDHLVAIQAKDSHLSPVSIISNMTGEEMSQLFVVPGMEVMITPEAMIFPTFLLSLEDTFYVGLQLTDPLGTEQAVILEKEIEDVLRNSQSGGLDLLFQEEVKWNIFQKAAAVRLHKAYDLYQEGAFEDSARELAHILGLGTGLTPCGDDFICGVFAGIIFLAKKEHAFTVSLRRHVSEHLMDTNIISQTFIKCSMEGQFSAAVKALTRGISKEEISDQFREIGHSSGFDSLCGILYSMRLFTPE